MQFSIAEPKITLNKAFLKQTLLRSEINVFKANLLRLFGKVDEIEREENQKNHIRDFLRDTYYKETNEINTKDFKDLVIHTGKHNKSNVAVIIEAKRPSNKGEMFSVGKPNTKALHEIILYYLDERNKADNNEVKQLLITNVYEWYIIDANIFDKIIYRNAKIKKLYETYTNDKKDTTFFYEEIAKIIPQIDATIECTFFDIRHYEKVLRSNDASSDKKLIALLKILSPYHLLKLKFADDSNKLDEKFYKELLHIIGLEEAKEGSKSIIRRKITNRNAGSLLENAIEQLQTEELHKLSDITSFGETNDEQYFNIALELCITWINRILFLKLLEAQLVNYHSGNQDFKFLHIGMVNDFHELYKLFHQVLARTNNERTDAVRQKYNQVPYLNSSLFDISELEGHTIRINALDYSVQLELISTTILKNEKKQKEKLPALEYLFKFLEAYDFASEETDEIQDDNKKLINASVLGKVFEKINGYKDGSIFTPGFITMHMCRQAIRLAVLQKFKTAYNWKAETFDDLKNYLADSKSSKDILAFNAIINSLRLCDPAVGSGHYLVSSLNEIIAIKYELGILADDKGIRFAGYEIEVINDELFIDKNREFFKYEMVNGKPKSSEAQRLQKTLFHEKETIIENCLFGVDINPKSVMICRLRLWIELLKNAYYTESSTTGTFHSSRSGSGGTLETLPNIDINIKCGNSLISRYQLKEDVFERIPNFKKKLDDYKFWVSQYKNTKDRKLKQQLTENIRVFKDEFKKRDPRIVKLQNDLNKKNTEFYEKFVTQKLFAEMADLKVVQQKEKLETDIAKLSASIDLLKTDLVYKNAFEWRFEFPEVLNEEGNFEGFDVVVGNPPYIRQELFIDIKKYLEQHFSSFVSSADLYIFFIEIGLKISKENSNFSFIVPNKWMKAGLWN